MQLRCRLATENASVGILTDEYPGRNGMPLFVEQTGRVWPPEALAGGYLIITLDEDAAIPDLICRAVDEGYPLRVVRKGLFLRHEGIRLIKSGQSLATGGRTVP